MAAVGMLADGRVARRGHRAGGFGMAAAHCVAIARNLFGFTRDVAAGVPDSVICAIGGTHACAAGPGTASMGAAALAREPRHPVLTAWFEATHCMIYGFSQGHARAPRYRAVHEFVGMAVPVAVSPACPDPF